MEVEFYVPFLIAYKIIVKEILNGRINGSKILLMDLLGIKLAL